MIGGDGYLSRDREHLARLQRERRQSMTRIDYMPSREALGAIDGKRATLRPGSVAATNSAVLNAIVTEWAELTGIKWEEIESPKTSGNVPELKRHDAQARMTSEPMPDWLLRMMARAKPTPAKRVACGAKRHRDGQPCRALSEPRKRRCRFHGGRSTGPRTEEGKARALANLKQGRSKVPGGAGHASGAMAELAEPIRAILPILPTP